jgi:outer membrane protein OmpA-like peptidoglycan-associated protein
MPYPAPAPPTAAPAGRVHATYAVYFAFNSDRLTGTAQSLIHEVAASFHAGSNPPVVVIGNAGRSGTASYNIDLSRRRAEAVRDALIAAGVANDAISVS